jgi:hypothetical protein
MQDDEVHNLLTVAQRMATDFDMGAAPSGNPCCPNFIEVLAT